MPRSRNIKPGIIQNDELASLDPYARIAFPHLWMLADFKGNIEYKPAKLKVQALPYDDVDIEFILSELERGGFIQKYHENGSHYLHICKFEKHQNPHKNEVLRGTNIPTPEEVSARAKPEEKPDVKQELDQGTDQVETETEQGRHENGSNPADSLIPDSGSLIPEEQQGSTSGDDSPASVDPDVVRDFPLKDGSDYIVPEDFVDKLKDTYRKLDVEHHLRCARLWLVAAPSRRKTKRGMTKFLNGWMGRQKPTAEIHQIQRQSRHTGFDERDYSEGLIEGVSDDAANF